MTNLQYQSLISSLEIYGDYFSKLAHSIIDLLFCIFAKTNLDFVMTPGR